MSVRPSRCYYFGRFRFVSLFGRFFHRCFSSLCCCRCLFFFAERMKSSLCLVSYFGWPVHSKAGMISTPISSSVSWVEQHWQRQTNKRTNDETIGTMKEERAIVRERDFCIFFFSIWTEKQQRMPHWWCWWWCGVLHDGMEKKRSNSAAEAATAKYEKKTRKCEDREINNLNEWKTENNS